MKEKIKEEAKSWINDTLGVRFIKFLTGKNRSRDFKLSLLLIPILFILTILLIILLG